MSTSSKHLYSPGSNTETQGSRGKFKILYQEQIKTKLQPWYNWVPPSASAHDAAALTRTMSSTCLQALVALLCSASPKSILDASCFHHLMKHLTLRCNVFLIKASPGFRLWNFGSPEILLNRKVKHLLVFLFVCCVCMSQEPSVRILELNLFIN